MLNPFLLFSGSEMAVLTRKKQFLNSWWTDLDELWVDFDAFEDAGSFVSDR